MANQHDGFYVIAEQLTQQMATKLSPMLALRISELNTRPLMLAYQWMALWVWHLELWARSSIIILHWLFIFLCHVRHHKAFGLVALALDSWAHFLINSHALILYFYNQFHVEVVVICCKFNAFLIK